MFYGHIFQEFLQKVSQDKILAILFVTLRTTRPVPAML